MGNPDHAVIVPLEGLAGSSVQKIARGMIRAVAKLDMPVSLDMNGTHLIAFPGTTLADIRQDYEAQLASCRP